MDAGMTLKEKWAAEAEVTQTGCGCHKDHLQGAWLTGFDFAKVRLLDIESINTEPWYEEYVRTLGEEESK